MVLKHDRDPNANEVRTIFTRPTPVAAYRIGEMPRLEDLRLCEAWLLVAPWSHLKSLQVELLSKPCLGMIGDALRLCTNLERGNLRLYGRYERHSMPSPIRLDNLKTLAIEIYPAGGKYSYTDAILRDNTNRFLRSFHTPALETLSVGCDAYTTGAFIQVTSLVHQSRDTLQVLCLSRIQMPDTEFTELLHPLIYLRTLTVANHMPYARFLKQGSTYGFLPCLRTLRLYLGFYSTGAPQSVEPTVLIPQAVIDLERLNHDHNY
ncbi:hypothetical protein BKA70DRAFT_1520527 [Coprinopsis sp. MPI-PUGE-AT-0042]|nr:hypothetical protein BKA70DRAFT_1520527 [Coprinopsis sp. MPI-PUGE-AT-0042]